MLSNILLGSFLIIIIGIMHSVVTRIVIEIIKRKQMAGSAFRNIIHIDMVVLITISAILAEATVWATTYKITGAIERFEEALYFSIVTFTTLGYGDVILSAQYRLLASFEAANGVIIFGWSTALVMASVQNLISLKKKQ